MLKISEETDLRPIVVEILDNPVYCHNVQVELDGNPCYYDIETFLKDDKYPK